MTTTMVPVTDLLARISYSVDAGPLTSGSDWHNMIAAKIEDESFWALVDTIPDEGFLYPICIAREYHEAPDGWTLGNGHHRLAAAILLGLDEIPVFLTDPGDDNYMHEESTTPDGYDDDKGLPWTDPDYTLMQAIAPDHYEWVDTLVRP